jgi:hypothetical protein
MRNTIYRIIAVMFLVLIAVPALAGNVVHFWECTVDEGKTMAEVDAVSLAWLKAAKGMKGGSEFDVYIDTPIAAQAGEGRFDFVLIAPSFQSWGDFNEGYPGSAAEAADEAFGDVASCQGSSVWYSRKME